MVSFYLAEKDFVHRTHLKDISATVKTYIYLKCRLCRARIFVEKRASIPMIKTA